MAHMGGCTLTSQSSCIAALPTVLCCKCLPTPLVAMPTVLCCKCLPTPLVAMPTVLCCKCLPTPLVVPRLDLPCAPRMVGGGCGRGVIIIAVSFLTLCRRTGKEAALTETAIILTLRPHPPPTMRVPGNTRNGASTQTGSLPCKCHFSSVLRGRTVLASTRSRSWSCLIFIVRRANMHLCI